MPLIAFARGHVGRFFVAMARVEANLVSGQGLAADQFASAARTCPAFMIGAALVHDRARNYRPEGAELAQEYWLLKRGISAGFAQDFPKGCGFMTFCD
ncbi:hypothetical protein [Arthrobacter sp. M4]|uniref:hypothetical protein n=1 Tax=Arthrobacter sp. M4 TaxID=218160 RepID=UPI001CDB699A|nr:hypothetical protein [Arthrobacter sp. M4]MCA4132083.1 hypothetical protein [Arthrobacter sp. M4]